MPGALSHLRVIEWCDQIPGATCGRQFAAWGAEVTAVETPDGSPLRRRAPLVTPAHGEPVSLLWEYLAAGKDSLALDLDRTETRAALRAAIEGADIFITDQSAATLARAGANFEALHAVRPALVFLHLSPYGTDGPYARYQQTELIVQALSGFMALNGLPEREPLKAAGNLTLAAAGVSAFIGALAALRARQRDGVGQRVDVSVFEAVSSLVPLLRSEYSGVDAVRQGGPVSGTFMFRCADGYIGLSPAGARNNWPDLLAALDVDPDTLTPEQRDAEVAPDTPRRFIEDYAPQHGARDLFTRLNAGRIACGLANGPADLLHDTQLDARSFYFDIDHPSLGRVRFPGPPARMSATPQEIADCGLRIADSPGEQALGSVRANPPVARLNPQSAIRNPQSPLAGLRVLDLTAAWLGPYASMLLADLGAEVIKIESPKKPDGWRRSAVPRGGPSAWISRPTNPRAHPWNTNASFNSVNRNKRGLALDLTNAEGKALFLRLAADADLVLENFTPRVMGNFSLGYDVLRQVNPRLVMVSFSGYGASGPYRDFRANGATTDTTCGWAALTGYADAPPMMMGTMEADPLSGLQMAATALVALAYRDETGEGQHVDGSMFETCAGYISEELLLATETGDNPPRASNRDRQMAPHGTFPCRGDRNVGNRDQEAENGGDRADPRSAVRDPQPDAWVAITVRDDRDWQALVSVAGDAALTDARFATAAGRLAQADELEDRLRAWTRTLSASEVMGRLQGAGVPAGVVQNYLAVLDDPQHVARGWFQRVTHPDMGTHRYNGFPWRFARASLAVHRPPPRVGEHSAEVLTAELGLSPTEVERLMAARVTATVLENQRGADSADR